MTGRADRWIRSTIIGCVGVLALIAGTVSYLHMHLLVQLHGQPGSVAALTPLSVDGMIVAASTTLLAESRSGGRGAAPASTVRKSGRGGYAFTGSLFCGVCARRMQGQWINAAPYHRCRFPAEYALANKVSHPANVYLRQDAFDARINQWLATVFAPARRARSHCKRPVNVLTSEATSCEVSCRWCCRLVRDKRW